MARVQRRRQVWLVLGAPLVALLLLFVGPSAFAQDYPPTTTSTTVEHGHGGGEGRHDTTTSTTSAHGHGHGHGNAVAGDSFQATTTTDGATVLANSTVRTASALPFTGAQLAGLVVLALALIAIGLAFVLRARRPRSTPH